MTYNSNITEPYLVNHETFCSTWMSEVHLRCTPVIHSELKLKIFSVKGKKKKCIFLQTFTAPTFNACPYNIQAQQLQYI